MRRWAIINVLLGVVVLLLAIQIARTWARGVPMLNVTSRAPAPEEREKGKRGSGEKVTARAEQAPPEMVALITQKDLFDSSRRAPSEEAKVEVARETGPPQGFTVVGVRIVGKDREVFVTDASQGNQQRRLRTGDQLAGGYTIKAIEATSLTLVSSSGETVNMPLALEKGKAQTPPRAARAGQPQTPQSPAAGTQGASPAAGVAVKPPAAAPPTPAAATPPARTAPSKAEAQPMPGRTPTGQLPTEVREKLEALKQNDARSRLGRKRQ